MVFKKEKKIFRRNKNTFTLSILKVVFWSLSGRGSSHLFKAVFSSYVK